MARLSRQLIPSSARTAFPKPIVKTLLTRWSTACCAIFRRGTLSAIGGYETVARHAADRLSPQTQEREALNCIATNARGDEEGMVLPAVSARGLATTARRPVRPAPAYVEKDPEHFKAVAAQEGVSLGRCTSGLERLLARLKRLLGAE